MSAEFSEAPINPKWERWDLLTNLENCLRANAAVAAYRVNDDLETLTILEGTVDRFSDDDNVHYQDIPVFLVGRCAIDGSQMVALGFGTVMSSLLNGYDLKCSASSLDSLTVPDTRLDEFTSDRLRRSVFDRVRSEAFAKLIFDAPVFTNWHTTLGIL